MLDSIPSMDAFKRSFKRLMAERAHLIVSEREEFYEMVDMAVHVASSWEKLYDKAMSESMRNNVHYEDVLEMTVAELDILTKDR
jgi:hypothetical protein